MADAFASKAKECRFEPCLAHHAPMAELAYALVSETSYSRFDSWSGYHTPVAQMVRAPLS